MKKNLKESCADCNVTKCINLFIHEKSDDDFEGGELFVYKLLNHDYMEEEDLSWHICSNGVLLRSSCFIIDGLNTSDKYEDLLIISSNELVRDLKASIFLAFSGHYRQATQILRCVFETFLYGLYFHVEEYKFSTSEEDQEHCKKNFKSWFEGGFRKSEAYLREMIRRGNIIDKDEEKEWGKLFNNLSKYIHTLSETVTGKLVKHNYACEYGDCYAKVKFDKEQLIQWSIYYQQIVGIILHTLIKIYPEIKKTDAGREVLGDIRAEVNDNKQQANSYLSSISRMKIPSR